MPTVTRVFYLDLNSVPLATPAWEIEDLSPLLEDPPVIGSNRKIPDGPTVAYPKFMDDHVITLLLKVFGDLDQDGDPAAGGLEGMLTNWDYLKVSLGFALQTGDGTVPAVFHRGDLDSMAADVHFLGFKGPANYGEEHILTSFDIGLPAGTIFEAVGS